MSAGKAWVGVEVTGNRFRGLRKHALIAQNTDTEANHVAALGTCIQRLLDGIALHREGKQLWIGGIRWQQDRSPPATVGIRVTGNRLEGVHRSLPCADPARDNEQGWLDMLEVLLKWLSGVCEEYKYGLIDSFTTAAIEKFEEDDDGFRLTPIRPHWPVSVCDYDQLCDSPWEPQ